MADEKQLEAMAMLEECVIVFSDNTVYHVKDNQVTQMEWVGPEWQD